VKYIHHFLILVAENSVRILRKVSMVRDCGRESKWFSEFGNSVALCNNYRCHI
jgi:hypothetical protein